jgi:hypothetical protein
MMCGHPDASYWTVHWLWSRIRVWVCAMAGRNERARPKVSPVGAEEGVTFPVLTDGCV